MQTSFIIGLAAAAVAVLLGFAVVMQRMEEQRQLRARQVRDLGIRIRKYWTALTEMPAGMLTPALQMILVRGISIDLRTLQKLQPNAREISHYTTQLQEIIPRIKEAEPAPERLQLGNEAMVRETRARLRSLHQLVLSLNESRQLDAAATQQFLDHIGQMNGETLHALYMAQARRAIQEGKPPVAIHHLDSCAMELAKINQQGNWHARIGEIRELQSNIEKFGAFSEEEGAELQRLKAESEAASADAGLGAQLDEMMAEENSWKKKVDYD